MSVTVPNILHALFNLVLTRTRWTRYFYHLHFIRSFFTSDADSLSLPLEPPPNGLKFQLPPFLPFQFLLLTQKFDWCVSHEWSSSLLQPASFFSLSTTEDPTVTMLSVNPFFTGLLKVNTIEVYRGKSEYLPWTKWTPW